ncbi:MAG: phosphatidylglycerol lysyltransferase domain-containing protein [Nitrospiraceae bacterium]
MVASSSVEPRAGELIQIERVGHYVPSRTCLTCEVCCRFPDADSFLRPYFTGEEIQVALGRGLSSSSFRDQAGCQIEVQPHPAGQGYLCPAFDAETHHCRIYDVRPLDCRLYPLAVMWDRTHREVLLGWDMKCPFLFDNQAGLSNQPAFLEYVAETARYLEQDSVLTLVERHPSLVTRFQEDVVVLQSLPALTVRLTTGVTGPWSDLLPRPLELADRVRFETAAAASPLSPEIVPSARLFANHYLWRQVLSYSWADLDGYLCLFAESPDGIFMPVPPLGPGSAPTKARIASLFAWMNRRNGRSLAARIESVPATWKGELEAWGYRVLPKEPEYLYRANDLAELRGDDYKSQRASYNRFCRTHRATITRYQSADAPACAALYEEWQDRKLGQSQNEAARYCLEDSRSFHLELLANAEPLGLAGQVVRVDGRIRAYTFGGALTREVWCVLAEIADRSMSGLAEYVFREGVRSVLGQGYRFINTMDAFGLPSLAQSKQAYHPVHQVRTYVAQEP